MTSRAVIGLGGNLGDRAANIREALTLLDLNPRIQVISNSSLYESFALTLEGMDESAPSYLNAVAVLETDLTPFELLAEANDIEESLGRVRLERWAARTLDIDIITFGDLEMTTDELVLPHPRAKDRAFVLVPWAEIEPEAVLIGVGRVSDLAQELDSEVWLHAGD